MGTLENFLILFVMLGVMLFTGGTIFCWSLLNRMLEQEWQERLTRWLYSEWDDAYRKGYDDGQKALAPTWPIGQPGIVRQIWIDGYERGRRDSERGCQNGAYCYGLLNEREPEALKLIQNLVNKEVLEKIKAPH